MTGKHHQSQMAKAHSGPFLVCPQKAKKIMLEEQTQQSSDADNPLHGICVCVAPKDCLAIIFVRWKYFPRENKNTPQRYH